MTSHTLTLFFALAFAVAAVSAVTITYYSDANCATKATTLPNGVSNPIVGALNACVPFGGTSLKYTTCSTSAGITQQSFTDGNCGNKVAESVIPGAGIGLCAPLSGGGGLNSLKYECSSSSALTASVLGVIATAIALLL